ncbi:MAG: hypothetical protein HY210_05090, partial [Candidatus Omnitrophica bacterium]|nr:hypothetical protein [Candidatus Omnitrophota bacterium]
VIYPLCFWIPRKDPLKNDFHKFHIALPNVVGGVTVVSLLFMDIPLTTKLIVLLWKGAFIVVSMRSWKQQYPDALWMSIPPLLGTCAVYRVMADLTGAGGPISLIAWILGGCIFSAALFAMNLGHWYLNVHGLPIAHLKRAVNVLGFSLAARLVWDAWFLATGKIFYGGEWIPIVKFIANLDGFFLLIALVFGVLFPLVSLYFVHGTLKLKNTQSTTGILHVILCAVLIGDMAYKYYMIKFGVYL